MKEKKNKLVMVLFLAIILFVGFVVFNWYYSDDKKTIKVIDSNEIDINDKENKIKDVENNNTDDIKNKIEKKLISEKLIVNNEDKKCFFESIDGKFNINPVEIWVFCYEYNKNNEYEMSSIPVKIIFDDNIKDIKLENINIFYFKNENYNSKQVRNNFSESFLNEKNDIEKGILMKEKSFFEHHDLILKNSETNYKNNDSKNDNSHDNSLLKGNTMTIMVPRYDWNDDDNDPKTEVIFDEYNVLRTPRILNAIYRKYFEISPNEKREGLSFDSVSINLNKMATVFLVGEWEQLGDMTPMAFKKEIEEAAFQFNSVDSIRVMLNNQLFDWCLDDMLGVECGEDQYKWIVSKNI